MIGGLLTSLVGSTLVYYNKVANNKSHFQSWHGVSSEKLLDVFPTILFDLILALAYWCLCGHSLRYSSNVRLGGG
jgi:hypothetical protein